MFQLKRKYLLLLYPFTILLILFSALSPFPTKAAPFFCASTTRGKRKLLFYLSRGFTPQFYYTELQGEITTESSKNFFENFCSHLVITLFFDKKYF